MLLNAFLRMMGSRCPACFKRAGQDAVRHGMQLFCSPEHRDKYLKGGDAMKRALERAGGGGCSAC